jgi:LysR family transcriptional activator of glutamate synthase operon
MTFDESVGVRWHKLLTQRLYAVVDREHQLAHRKLIGFEELAGESFVSLDRDHTLRWILEDACTRHGLTAATPSADTVEIAIDDKDLVRPIAVGWMISWARPCQVDRSAAISDSSVAMSS